MTQGSGDLVLEASTEYFNGDDICPMAANERYVWKSFPCDPFYFLVSLRVIVLPCRHHDITVLWCWPLLFLKLTDGSGHWQRLVAHHLCCLLTVRWCLDGDVDNLQTKYCYGLVVSLFLHILSFFLFSLNFWLSPMCRKSIQEFYNRHALEGHCIACAYRPLPKQVSEGYMQAV